MEGFTPVDSARIDHFDHGTIARHGTFDVEHVDLPQGLRQNFIVHERPPGKGPLRVELQPGGNLTCEHVADDHFQFVDAAGIAHLTYSDLHVWDADGDTLVASAFMEEGLVVLVVEDDDANYPIVVDPLANTTIWAIESNMANAQMGTSLASAGDVNGDGYSDVIIGTPVWSNGQVGEGRAQVHFGSATGPSPTISWSFETDQVGANLGIGTSVATAGDVNGDGYSDIIVGAPYYDNGQTDEGRVFVFYGSATGLSATPDWTAEIDQAYALFGYSVNCAGDVNGDGYSDVVVGAYQYSNGQVNEGAVFVYHGSATGLSATPDWIGEGNQTAARYGFSVASAGDVNGDGYSDLIVGAPLFDNGQTNEGRAFVYHGSATGLALTAARTMESNQASSQTGWAVSSAGDVNNDGYSDVAIGIPFYASTLANDGRVIVHLGSAGGVAAAAAWTYDSPTAQAQLGKALACAGDVNGDGYSDLVVGAPEHTNGQAQEGKAYTFFGNATAALTLEWQNELNQAGARNGAAVASAGDVNGDGFSDVLVGVPQWDNGQNNEGRARLFLGSAAMPLAVSVYSYPGPGDFGWSAKGAGDVNGDGYGDVIAGMSVGGTVRLYSGSPTGLLATPLWTRTLPGGYGNCVTGAGDVNGDGFSDIIIGRNSPHEVEVFHGSATGPATTPSWTFSTGLQNSDISVASAGDVNADGYSDVVIGARIHNGAAGIAYLFLGGPSGLGATPAWTSAPYDSPHIPGSNYGQGVAGAGDVNGDGYSDVLVAASSAPQYDGHVYLYLGGPAGLSPTPSVIINGDPAYQTHGSVPGFGATLCGAGDLNGDGYDDVVIASFGYLANIHYGSSTGISVLPDLTILNGASFFGASVAGAGDVNCDGYSDVAIGSFFGAFLYLGGPTGLSGTHQLQFQGGEFVDSAGDINGDGCSDVISGIPLNQRIHIFNGNGSISWARANLRLYETDLVTPIKASNIPEPQFGAGLFTRPFLGRTRTRMVWESRIQGQAFSTGSNNSINNSTAFTSQQSALVAGAVSGVELKALVDKPVGGAGITATKVRARVRYDPVTAITGQVYGPWRYMPGYLDGSGTHNNVPLPVELTHFEAACDNGKMRLRWSTASEENSSHFVVQRSSDTFTWTKVGDVQAAGHSHQIIAYEFRDDDPMLPAPIYYRLLQVDLDGTTAELPMATAQPCTHGILRIFPNPTSALLFVDLGTLQVAAAHIILLDASGRAVITQALGTGSGPVTIPMQQLAAGSYLLKVVDDRGETLAVERVAKE